MRGDFVEFGLDGVRDVEGVDEGRDALGGHGGVGAGQGLEGLVGLGIPFAAQDGLDGLGNDAPGVVQVGVNGRAVEQKLAQALHGRGDGDERVGQGHTHVAQNGRVGKVSLQARHGELGGQMAQHGIGYADVALRVLKVYRVDLVGHCRRADLALLDALLEVLHGDVHPHVAVKVEDDIVDARDGVEEGRQGVVVRNLGCKLLADYAELAGEELGAKLPPVNVGEGYEVGVEVARGAAKLAAELHGVQCLHLAAQTVGKHHDLLAQAGGRCRLAVGLGQHGYVIPLLGPLLQMVNHLHHGGAVEGGHGVDDAHGHRGVVDVLRCEAKVDILLVLSQPESVKLLLEEVLHSLDVVVGDRLYLLDATGVVNREVLVDGAQGGEDGVVHRRQRRQGYLAQGDKVLHLYLDAVADEGKF